MLAAKILPSSLFFLGLTALFALCYLGGIQLLNAATPRLPFRLARPIHWIHAMTFEFFALVGVTIIRFIPSREQVSGNGQPILLVHGYLHNGAVWAVQKKQLEKRGFGPIYTISFGHPFRSIEKYAVDVKEKAEAIAVKTGRKDLILIGHSMGGLVSAWYATQIAPPGTVTNVVTIGSPFEGTPLARIGLGSNAREMEPNSPFVKQLQTAISNNKTISFYHIAARCDQIVIPGISAVISKNPHFIMEDIGHVSLLFSRRVAHKIGEWLRSSL